jgi:16S rRNA (guanine966-N2)-methyltransferase
MEVVRNAIFNSLAELVPGARVLDLFAGTGGLGIEALSRGAAACQFVESDRRACEVIRRNLEKTRLTGGEVAGADAMRWLDRAAPPAGFHIVLADPPYVRRQGDRDFTAELLASEGLRRTLAPGGILVLEHLPDKPLPLGTEWECTRDKRYGATAVAFLRATRPA